MLYSKPQMLNVIWSSGGDKVAPDTAKYNTGWLAEIPPRQYFNFIDWKQDQWAAYSNQIGIPEWDNETEYQADKSVVQGSNGTIYQCLVTGTNFDPVSDISSRWRRVAIEEAPVNGLQYIRRNGQWQQIDSSAFAPAVHTHTIAQVDGLQNALNNKLNITGSNPTLNSITTTMTLDLSSPTASTSFVRGVVNGVNNWYVGKGSASSDDIALSSYVHGTRLTLQTDRVTTNQDIYVNTSRVWHAGNFNPSNYAAASHTHSWGQITGKPSTFPPSNHSAATITSGTLNGARLPTGIGGVGTYALMSPTSQGATRAGSSLNYCNAAGKNYGSTASGTWRCMGLTAGNHGDDAQAVSLFVRIS